MAAAANGPEVLVARPRASKCNESPDVISYTLTARQSEIVNEVISKELKSTVSVHEKLLQIAPDVTFKKMLSMNVTEMRRCLKHGRQRLQCNRPHAPLALCEKIIANISLGEFGHWLQLMYHLRRFAKGLVKTCQLTTDMQAALVDKTQSMIMLSIPEHSESDVWVCDPAREAYVTDLHVLAQCSPRTALNHIDDMGMMDTLKLCSSNTVNTNRKRSRPM